MVFKKLFYSCINILFPSICIVCETHPAAYPLPICGECKKNILNGSSPPVLSSDRLQKIWSCRIYEGAVKECIKKFKYCGKRHLISIFEEMTRRFLVENDISPASVICPKIFSSMSPNLILIHCFFCSNKTYFLLSCQIGDSSFRSNPSPGTGYQL